MGTLNNMLKLKFKYLRELRTLNRTVRVLTNPNHLVRELQA